MQIMGADDAINVLKATGDTKLKNMVGESFMEQYGLKNSMKVKGFKDWLMGKTVRAELELEEQLTKPQNK
jgi:hypothetical protein